jgi:hypothetical protein
MKLITELGTGQFFAPSVIILIPVWPFVHFSTIPVLMEKKWTELILLW